MKSIISFFNFSLAWQGTRESTEAWSQLKEPPRHHTITFQPEQVYAGVFWFSEEVWREREHCTGSSHVRTVDLDSRP